MLVEEQKAFDVERQKEREEKKDMMETPPAYSARNQVKKQNYF